MSSIMSILSSSYASAAQSQSLIAPGSKFAPVNPTLYQGTWTGKDPLGQPFTLKISNVKGYRANVTFESSSGLQYGQVFITTKNSFRIGNSSFTLTGKAGDGTAQINTVVTNSTTGTQTVQTSTATLKT